MDPTNDTQHPSLFSHRRVQLIVTGLTVIMFSSAGSLFYFRSPNVLLTVGGISRHVRPKASTVGQLLQEEKVVLAAEDFVSPPLETTLRRNMAVKVTRVVNRIETSEVTLPPQVRWSQRTRQNLRRVLVQKGFVPKTIRKSKVTWHDGVEVNRKIISERLVKKPFFTLTLFSNRGFPIKTYDLLKVPTKKFLATAYYVGDPMVPGDETFLGYKLQRGLVAVDPKTIPLRMRLYIPGYGYAYSADTGSAIKGERIDLAVKDAKEERRYNHMKATIYLLEKAKKW